MYGSWYIPSWKHSKQTHYRKSFISCDTRRSVAGVLEDMGDSHNVLFAISSVLGFLVAHWNIFTPDSDDQSFIGLGDTGTSTTLSGQIAELDSLVGFVSSQEHVLLVADSKTAVLSSLSVSSGGLHHGGVLVAEDLLGGTIFLWLIELVGGELESLRGSPGVSVVAIDTSILTNVGHSPSIGIWIKGVLNLMDVSIPA